MEEKSLQNNYILTIVKLVLFLIIFCFLVELSKVFLKEIRLKESLKIGVLFNSILFCFAFYTFLADLDNLYRKIQKFFFRSTFFFLCLPSLVILLGLCFFLFPKIIGFSFSKELFLFLGGFAFTSHMIFVARQIKGHTFTGFVNYLFMFSILYILNLIIFGVYLKVVFNLHLTKLLFEGIREGASSIKILFVQLFK
ncbi:MAG: hypothetical protein J7K71_04245 [Candidatus Omnitrophica bacterium]|nr:hypothetical protein [Candidatus Omnitrophota bacterium]